MSQRNIVLDTNCLIQIISRRSSKYFLWKKFLDGEYNLCITNDIMEEYEEILCEKANRYIASLVLDIIRQAPNTYEFDAQYRWHLITADPDDNKFVDCAIVANADYIVSEDNHFSVLKTIPFPKVNVIRLDKFAQLYQIGDCGDIS
jgi:putative PIN family toxin of toxin-antitoxin system